MLKIIETESLQAVVRIGEDVISEIECGQPAIITGNGFKGKSYKGFVDVISAAAVTEEKSTQSMVETIISIDNPDKYLKSGYTVKVNVVTDIIKNAITIQSDTILQDDNNNEYVFVVSNGSAKKRFIKTGEYTSQGVIVTNGLQEGEVVALNPDELDGEIINVINLGEGE